MWGNVGVELFPLIFFILGGSFSGDYRRSFYFANFSLSKGLFGPGFVLCDIGLEFD